MCGVVPRSVTRSVATQRRAFQLLAAGRRQRRHLAVQPLFDAIFQLISFDGIYANKNKISLRGFCFSLLKTLSYI